MCRAVGRLMRIEPPCARFRTGTSSRRPPCALSDPRPPSPPRFLALLRSSPPFMVLAVHHGSPVSQHARGGWKIGTFSSILIPCQSLLGLKIHGQRSSAGFDFSRGPSENIDIAGPWEPRRPRCPLSERFHRALSPPPPPPPPRYSFCGSGCCPGSFSLYCDSCYKREQKVRQSAQERHPVRGRRFLCCTQPQCAHPAFAAPPTNDTSFTGGKVFEIFF
ncbi:hypothetical protein HJG60_010389 [Phyllostomus discolor]|uniref:Uncharacterized protein n=1 Tax=Phyllostomus discolor TaxID=89673 RepID=A0A834AT25_9CHIR|nr:hypothetical protein HJG60_010389 [Phyllostomus discolor]